MGKEKKNEANRLPASLRIGAIASAFLIIGYQIALFMHSAAVERIVSNRDMPDTVYVYRGDAAIMDDGYGNSAHAETMNTAADAVSGHESGRNDAMMVRKGSHSRPAQEIYEKNHSRSYESFTFDPNTVSLEDLQRLGFTEKQAISIDNYRQKGGRFHRASDFAKSYVVADSVFRRLEKYIKIPKTDINTADSAAFDLLPGIGPYYAARMVSYREQLGGYSYPEQLMDIYGFDQDRFDSLKDLISLSPPAPYPLWTLPEKELEKHPYIGKYGAHGIIVFRENNPPSKLTVENVAKAGILKQEDSERLIRCRIAAP